MKKQDNPFELEVVSVRLVQDAPIYSDHPIEKPGDAAALLGEYMCDMDREVVCVINLRSDGKAINCHFASMGAINYAMAHPRELFKASILSNAANMILVHNHPSGNLSPSEQDTMLTDQMIQLSESMGIPLLDHIIVGGRNEEYFSFKEKDILPVANIKWQKDYKMLDFKPSLVAEKDRRR